MLQQQTTFLDNYQQHCHYFINTMHNTMCPRTWFQNDLLWRLKHWPNKDEQLVLCMNANEDIYLGMLGCALTDRDRLAMEEPVEAITGQKIGSTFFRGSKPIDMVWVTSDILVLSVCVHPVGYGVGDHGMFTVDISNSSFVGANNPPIKWPSMRRLTTKSPQTVQWYNGLLEQQVTSHQCLEQLYQVYQQGCNPTNTT